jgi:DNA polymerase I-like protein with 3'-5' exonuclease and polymerase domains
MWEPLTFNTGTPKKLEDAQKEYAFGIKRAFTYRALNRLIQGSAADMTKMSLIRLHEEGVIPHIQIHDEVDISVESSEHASKIIEIMESAVKLEIPNKVDYESGDNWGDIK